MSVIAHRVVAPAPATDTSPCRRSGLLAAILPRVTGRTLAVAALCFVATFGAHAKEAAPLAEDPAVEAKVMAISHELRCLVCQNQTIADSNAELAVDLRREVREMVKKGMDKQQVVSFMEDRYGDFVRYRPAFKASTVLLWVGPFALLVGALAVLFFNVLRKRKIVNETQPLTPEEQQRFAALMANRDASGDSKS